MTQDTRTNPGATEVPTPKKHRKVFLWFFLALQALFLVWAITGASSGAHNTSQAQDAGTTLGVGLIILLWALIDIIVGGTYAVYRLVTRK